jgi:hypothetical protein
MAKPNIWRDKIIEILENVSLNYKNLFDKVKSEVNKALSKKGKSASARPKRLFDEQLVKLIDSGNLVITGYDKSVNNVTTGRIQSFKNEGIIFELVRTDKLEPMDILLLLNQLGDIDNSKLGTAQIKLSKIFETRFIDYENQEIDFYEQIHAKVRSEPLAGWISEYEKNLEKLKSEYDADPSFSSEISKLQQDLKSHRHQLNKHPNSIIWSVDGLTTEEACKILDIETNTPKNPNFRDPLHYPALANGKVVKGFTPKEVERIMELRRPWLDENGNCTPEQFLEEKGLFKLEEKTQEEIQTLFGKMCFFISGHDNYNLMKQGFSLALSDEENSLELFVGFLKNITEFEEKLKNELRIDTETER